jgi:hypothetical protein
MNDKILIDREVVELALGALENAIGQLAKPYSTGCVNAIAALCDALEQPEQEPVAWVTIYMGRPSQFFKNDDAEKKARAEIERLNREYPQDRQKRYAAPLYTHPPRREWVGLTDEDIKTLLPGAVRIPPGWRDTVVAIEAKLKEKNNG